MSSVRELADGTLVIRHGRNTTSFKPAPWMTRDEILNRIKYELMVLGASVHEKTPQPPLRRR